MSWFVDELISWFMTIINENEWKYFSGLELTQNLTLKLTLNNLIWYLMKMTRFEEFWWFVIVSFIS